MKYFLGVNIKRDRQNKKLSLDMRAYIQDKINLFGLAHLKSTSTAWHKTDPKDMGEELDAQNTTLFRAMIGSLIWITLVRPDVAHAVGKLSSSMHRPYQCDLEMAKRCFRYLKGTMDDVLTYSRDFADREAMFGVGYLWSPTNAQSICSAYVDSNLEAPRSTTGFVFKMAGGMVMAKSKKQPVTAVMTYDAEYYAFSMCCMVAIWLSMFLKEIDYMFFDHFKSHLIKGPIVVHGDNSAVIRMIQEHAISTRARHIQLRWHHMMDAIMNGDIEAHGIMGKFNPSDNLTKGLDGPNTTLQRQDMLGIALMDKAKGVTIPPRIQWKPIIHNYSAILDECKFHWD